MKNIIWLFIFSMLKPKTYSERWTSSASFSKQNSYDNEMKLYHKPPIPFTNTHLQEENAEANALHDTSETGQNYAFNPFYPEFLYPPQPIPLPSPNDVLVIILEQKMKCSNESQHGEQPPQPTPKIFPPPSRCIWAILACCAPTSATFRYTCFNFLGCSGSFWEINPCQLPVIMLAANDALAYYKQFEPQPTPAPSPPTQAPSANANVTQVPSAETTIEASTSVTTETTTVSSVSEQPPAS